MCSGVKPSSRGQQGNDITTTFALASTQAPGDIDYVTLASAEVMPIFIINQNCDFCQNMRPVTPTSELSVAVALHRQGPVWVLRRAASSQLVQSSLPAEPQSALGQVPLGSCSYLPWQPTRTAWQAQLKS